MKDLIKIQITVPRDFEKFMNELEKLGYTRSEMVKTGIRMLHKKEFPPYTVKAKTRLIAEELTDDELCTEVFHGTVVEEGGIKVCKIRDGNFTDTIPVSALRGQIPAK